MNTDKTTLKQTFPITGMSCAACAVRVNKTLNKQKGVYSANVNYASATAIVEFDTAVSSPEQLKKAVQEAGYDLLLACEEKDMEAEVEKQRKSHYLQLKKETKGAVLLSIPISIIAMGFHNLPYAGTIMWILSTPVVFLFGKDFFIHAWKQLRHGTSNMDTLVATSTGIAYLFSVFNLLFPEFWTTRGMMPHLYFEAAAMIIAFILLGRTLEERAKGQTSDAIRQLMGLQPKRVTVIRSLTETEISIAEIKIGDIVIAKPGERIAVDGTVTEGESYVDESMLSGEPIAVRKTQGNKVYAGTINQQGSFRFTADKIGSGTLLAHIIRMVKEAQGSKAPVQKRVDKIAAIFVPTIITLAVITFFLWITLGGSEGFTHGLLAAVTVLIIACPCALGLATPTAIMVAMGRGAAQGILIKDAESLETARRIQTLILDKTGTITEGKPEAVEWEWTPNVTSEDKSVFYTMEKVSEHPLATAICKGLNGEEQTICHFESITGQGVKAFWQETVYLAGSSQMMKNQGIHFPAGLLEKANRWSQEAKTIVWFAKEKKIIGITAIADQVKKNSAEAISRLQQYGIDIIMLTGDNPKTAGTIARQVGIQQFQAEVLPEQKAEWVKRYQQEGKMVAMAGDGINDSAALAQSDLSIAMGQGSDIAMSVAQITLMSSDLSKIEELIKLSGDTVRIIRQNLFWAFFYNLIGVPLAAGILYPVNGFLLNPMIAGAAMAMSSVSVVTNSLRLRRRKGNSPYTTSQHTFSHECSGKEITTEQPQDRYKSSLSREYRIEGMMCHHCLARVEKALRSLDQTEVTVTLDPPVVTLASHSGRALPQIDELQKILTEKAGDYTISEK